MNNMKGKESGGGGGGADAAAAVTTTPPLTPLSLQLVAARVIRSNTGSDRDSFRIHPKGTGVVVTRQSGLPPNELIDEYTGELYAPWRWLEKEDAVAQAQRTLKMPPALPDFYNMLLERPSYDKSGYGLWYVDAGGGRASMASSLSHSCTPNCEPRMAVRNGKLTIVLVTLREIAPGEELTFDYGAVTTSESEYRSAVCLCGTSHCRQSFLHFVNAKNSQRLLERWHSPTHIFASLLDASVRSEKNRALNSKIMQVLDCFGLGKAAGLAQEDAPFWLRLFCSSVLGEFVIRERTMLPISLVTKGGFGNYLSANQEARSLIEQRVQSLVCSVNCVHHVLRHQPAANQDKGVKKKETETGGQKGV